MHFVLQLYAYITLHLMRNETILNFFPDSNNRYVITDYLAILLKKSDCIMGKQVDR